MFELGTQYLAEFYGCCVTSINDRAKVREAMLEAARIARATVVADVFHEFNPHGISGVVVIAESHLAVHSWPEHACASVDLFTCGDGMDPRAALEYLRHVFRAGRMDVQVHARGAGAGAMAPGRFTEVST